MISEVPGALRAEGPEQNEYENVDNDDNESQRI
jgi:hypothetical protein